jgi:hypothetical protein
MNDIANVMPNNVKILFSLPYPARRLNLEYTNAAKPAAKKNEYSKTM